MGVWGHPWGHPPRKCHALACNRARAPRDVRGYTGSRSGHGEELPLAGDALELVDAVLGELDTGADHEILDGARDEHLARASEPADASSQVYAYAADVIAHHLALASVNA